MPRFAKTIKKKSATQKAALAAGRESARQHAKVTGDVLWGQRIPVTGFAPDEWQNVTNEHVVWHRGHRRTASEPPRPVPRDAKTREIATQTALTRHRDWTPFDLAGPSYQRKRVCEMRGAAREKGEDLNLMFKVMNQKLIAASEDLKLSPQDCLRLALDLGLSDRAYKALHFFSTFDPAQKILKGQSSAEMKVMGRCAGTFTMKSPKEIKLTWPKDAPKDAPGHYPTLLMTGGALVSSVDPTLAFV